MTDTAPDSAPHKPLPATEGEACPGVGFGMLTATQIAGLQQRKRDLAAYVMKAFAAERL